MTFQLGHRNGQFRMRLFLFHNSSIVLINNSVTTPLLIRFAPSLMYIATLAKVRIMNSFFPLPGLPIP